MPVRQILSTTDQYPIPDWQPTSAQWPSAGILFLKLNYALTPDGLCFGYHDDSGFFPGLADVNAFVSAVSGGPPPSGGQPLPPTSSSTSLTVKIWQPCYVVVALHPRGNWEFRYDVGAICTDVNDSAAGKQYFNLRHYLNNRSTVPSQGAASGTVPSEPNKCRVVYFSAVSPSVRGSTYSPDQMNMFIRITQIDPKATNATTLALIIDPDIQNTGHPLVDTGDGGN